MYIQVVYCDKVFFNQTYLYIKNIFSPETRNVSNLDCDNNDNIIIYTVDPKQRGIHYVTRNEHTHNRVLIVDIYCYNNERLDRPSLLY